MKIINLKFKYRNNAIISVLSSLSINRALIIIGHFSFLILFFLSIFYYKQRIVFIDTVFQFFKIVNFGQFNIEAGRYSAVFSQIPLLLGVKAHLSLRLLMLIYSISFIAIYYMVFILCIHTFKNIPAALTIVFIFLLCIKQSFYHPSTETHQGLVYTALLMAILYYSFKENKQLLRYGLIIFAVILSFFSHPVALFTVLFVTGFYMVDRLAWRDQGAYIAIGLVLILCLLKLFFTNENSYEAGFFKELFVFNKAGSHVNCFSGLIFLRNGFRGLYFWLTLFFILTTGIQLFRKEYLKFAYTWLTTILFLVLTLKTYNKGDSIVMMERAFMPFTIFVMVPFLNAVTQKSERKLTPVLIFLIMFSLLAGVRRVHFEGQRFNKRYKYVEAIIEKVVHYDGSKFLLRRPDDPNTQVFTWTFPFTTIIISSLDGKENTKTIFLYDDINLYIKYLTSETNIFLGPDFQPEWRSDILNPCYFNLPEGPYQELK